MGIQYTGSPAVQQPRHLTAAGPSPEHLRKSINGTRLDEKIEPPLWLTIRSQNKEAATTRLFILEAAKALSREGAGSISCGVSPARSPTAPPLRAPRPQMRRQQTGRCRPLRAPNVDRPTYAGATPTLN